MSREPNDLGAGVGIVEPDANAGSHRQPCAVRRIGQSPVAPTDPSLAQAGEGSFGKRPASVVLGAAFLHEERSDQ